MKQFMIIDHTADIGIIAYGKDLGELFANSAYGMFSIITDIRKITDNKLQSIDIKLRANNLEELLVNWLNELLYQYNTQKIIFSQFKIKRLDEKYLEANVRGKPLTLNSPLIKAEIKAATYHQLKIEKKILKNKHTRWQAEVIFDV